MSLGEDLRLLRHEGGIGDQTSHEVSSMHGGIFLFGVVVAGIFLP